MTHMTDTGRARPITGRNPAIEHENLNQEILRRISGLTRLSVGVLNSLILLRYFLRLMGANLANPFARLIDSITDPFLSMFKGLIQTITYRGVTFEFSDLIAIVVFGLLGWIVVQLLRVMFDPDK